MKRVDVYQDSTGIFIVEATEHNNIDGRIVAREYCNSAYEARKIAEEWKHKIKEQLIMERPSAETLRMWEIEHREEQLRLEEERLERQFVW